MERKARIVRFWAAAILVALLGFWEPSLWFAVPLFWNCCCGCGNCTSTQSSQYQLDLSGISDNGADCGDCSQFNGTYTVTRMTDFNDHHPGSLADGDCAFKFAIDPCYCTGSVANNECADCKWAVHSLFLFFIKSGSNTLVQVCFSRTISPFGTSCHTTSPAFAEAYDFLWRKTAVGGADCAALSSESIPLINQSADACSSDTSAALVTAL